VSVKADTPFELQQKTTKMKLFNNQLIFIGKVGQDKKVSTTQTGSKIARFSMNAMAQNQINKDDKTAKRRTFFAWGDTADFIDKFAHAGKEITLQGKPVVRTYINNLGILIKVSEFEIQEVIRL
jgi:single-stranded DNA-binding protein